MLSFQMNRISTRVLFKTKKKTFDACRARHFLRKTAACSPQLSNRETHHGQLIKQNQQKHKHLRQRLVAHMTNHIQTQNNGHGENQIWDATRHIQNARTCVKLMICIRYKQDSMSEEKHVTAPIIQATGRIKSKCETRKWMNSGVIISSFQFSLQSHGPIPYIYCLNKRPHWNGRAGELAGIVLLYNTQWGCNLQFIYQP